MRTYPNSTRKNRKGAYIGGLQNVSFLVHCLDRSTMDYSKVPEVPVRFYRSESGNEPVLDWLRQMDKNDRRTIGLDLMRVQFGWPIGMPLVRNLKRGLWEVRSQLSGNRTARLLLCFHEGTLVVLHGFIKKTRATPVAEILLATRRMREVTR